MTDEKLKQALAKMLPEQVHMRSSDTLYYGTFKLPTLDEDGDLTPVLDTELLNLCAMVERSLKVYCDKEAYVKALAELDATEDCVIESWRLATATWRQRATALAKVKGIKV